jgi:UDP-GlcNAc:undecaprenyl-phosphate GlcNAc-1-phosphate transferase
VGITNAINLTDGLDGLASGVCFLAASVNAAVAIWLGNYYMAVMMILLAGALAGFLRWNFHPARVFLGDTGSLALGMFLALASLASAQKSHTAVMILVPLFALGYPIFDTLLAVARRTVRGQPLFASDRDHIHHRLLVRGASPSAAAVQIYLAAIIVSLLCVAAVTANHFFVGLALVGVLGVALFSARVLGYLEWGGWTARWSGRDETRALHAAAQLARLRIARAAGPREAIDALATIAPEILCMGMELRRGEEVFPWPPAPDQPPAPADALEMNLDDSFSLRIYLTPGQTLGEERAALVEELARLACSRFTGGS